MKKLVFLLVAAVLTFGTVSSALAEVSGGAYVGVFDKYLWRGFDLSDSKPVVQPGADLSVGGFTLGLWANVQSDSDQLHELDVTLDYTFDLGEMVSLSLGNITYIIEGGDNDSNEAYVGLALNTMLSPSLTVYYDWDAFDGDIFTVVGIGHELALADNLALNLGASASYSLPDTGDSFLHNAEFSAEVAYGLTDSLSINPLLLYSIPLSDDADNIIDNEFLSGLNVSYSF